MMTHSDRDSAPLRFSLALALALAPSGSGSGSERSRRTYRALVAARRAEKALARVEPRRVH
eukprot:2303227-Rhodomonas_salina.4